MRGNVSFGCGRRDDILNVANFLANIAILYVSVQILNISRNNAGYNARIMQSAESIDRKLKQKKE